MIKQYIKCSTIMGVLVIIGLIQIEEGNAHELPISDINIVESDSKIHLELKLNAFELAFLSEMDTNENNKIDKKEFEEHKEIIRKKILKTLTIKLDNTVLIAESSGLMLDMTSHHFVFRAHYFISENNTLASLKIKSELQKITDRSHVTRVTCNLGGQKQKARLDARNNTVTFNLREKSGTHILAGMIFNNQSLLILISGLLLGIASIYFIKN